MNFRLWSRGRYYLIFILLIAGLVLSLVFLLDLRLISALITAFLIFLWLYLIKKEWDSLALRIKELFKDYECRITYSILGGTTFLKEKALPFTDKFLRPVLGASIVYKGIRIRFNFSYFNPRLNPLILGSDYDYEVLILDFENEALTNELYAFGFKEKEIPKDVRVLITASINAYYIKNEEYVKNASLLITDLFNILNKYL